MTNKSSEVFFNAAQTHGAGIIKALLLINGGAVIAVLSHLGSFNEMSAEQAAYLQQSCNYFSRGIFLAMLGYIFIYGVQTFEFSFHRLIVKQPIGMSYLRITFFFIFYCFVFSSLICFKFGANSAGSAFDAYTKSKTKDYYTG